jgi:6-phosphogluconolactonase
VQVSKAWLDLIQTLRPGAPQRVGLSGGRIARTFFESTAREALRRKVRFDGVQFFWADERCVPPNHPDSNFAVAQRLLFEPLKISEAQVHRIRGELEPAQAAAEASEEIRRTVPLDTAEQPVLDLVFLGMGEDGHVASLFPNVPVEMSTPPYFAVVASKPPPNRVTLSYRCLSVARDVWVLVTSGGKKVALNASLQPQGTTPLAHLIKTRVNMVIFAEKE